MWLTFCACFSYLMHTCRTMAQIVSRQPFTVEARVQSQTSPCEICGEESGTGASFSSSISVLSARFHRCSIRVTPTLHKLITWQSRYIKRTSHPHPYYMACPSGPSFLFILLVFRGQSQWSRFLRSAAARLMRLWVRIPPEEGMYVCCECCVLSGRVLCDGLITRPEESYRLWCVVVCDLETSWMRRLWPTGGCRAKNQKKVVFREY
jgi:hypothetical protein